MGVIKLQLLENKNFLLFHLLLSALFELEKPIEEHLNCYFLESKYAYIRLWYLHRDRLLYFSDTHSIRFHLHTQPALQLYSAQEKLQGK